MNYKPIDDVQEQVLVTDQGQLDALRQLKGSNSFDDLPGDFPEEKARLSARFDAILDRIINGIADNPRKTWLLGQFLPEIDDMWEEDTEAREHFGEHLGFILDIFEIESSDGFMGYYLE